MTKDLLCFSSSLANLQRFAAILLQSQHAFSNSYSLDKNFKTNPLFFNRFSIKISDVLRRSEICLKFLGSSQIATVATSPSSFSFIVLF